MSREPARRGPGSRPSAGRAPARDAARNVPRSAPPPSPRSAAAGWTPHWRRSPLRRVSKPPSTTGSAAAGLIDAVIEKLVAAEMHTIMDKALQVADPWRAVATYVTDRRDLQYREPAFTDALLMTYQIRTAGRDRHGSHRHDHSLVQRSHDAG